MNLYSYIKNLKNFSLQIEEVNVQKMALYLKYKFDKELTIILNNREIEIKESEYMQLSFNYQGFEVCKFKLDSNGSMIWINEIL